MQTAVCEFLENSPSDTPGNQAPRVSSMRGISTKDKALSERRPASGDPFIGPLMSFQDHGIKFYRGVSGGGVYSGPNGSERLELLSPTAD